MSKPNYGILPLPNLETKFIAANTLIGIEKPSNPLYYYQYIATSEKDLRLLRHRYFRIKTRREKGELQKRDQELRKQIANILKKYGWPEEVAEKIASFDPFDQNASADWFDPEWMFGVRDGFDIAIGNPPYVRQEKIKKDKPLLQKQGYEVFTSTADLYVYFYEKGYQLLKQQGVLAYITSNKWMRAKYGEKLRKFLKEKTTIIKLIDFSGYRVFEQTVDTCILLFKKEKPPKGHTFEFLTVPSDVKDLESYLTKKSKYLIEQETETVLKRVESWSDVETWQELRDWQTAYVGNWQTMLQEKLSNNGWTLGDDKVLSLKEKIEKVGKPLKEWDVKIYFGIKTGYNDAFIIDTETRNRILANCKDEEERRRTEEIIKPVLRGRDIERYRYKWAGLWIILAKFGFYKISHLYPAVVEHLSKYEEQLKNRGQCRYTRAGKKRLNKDYPGQHHWLELDNNPTDEYLREFEKEKIVWQRVTKSPKFAIVPSGYYCEATTHFITTNEDAFYIRRYLLGIFNSKFFEFAFYKFYMGGGIEGEIKGEFIGRYPIPPLTPQTQPLADQIVQKVQEILTLTQSPDFETSQEKQQKVKELEREIDQLVYKLYGLTEEEIRLIESG